MRATNNYPRAHNSMTLEACIQEDINTGKTIIAIEHDGQIYIGLVTIVSPRDPNRSLSTQAFDELIDANEL